jgi:acetylornithine deacetylase/succinyl-diaminopimelate desuccinylase-like protein
MPSPDAAIAYAREHKPAFLDDLKSVIRIPSISTDVERVPDMKETAGWVAHQLRSFGFDQVAILPTAKHPVVTGQWLKAGSSAPTLLYYGHYDVQPVDPIDLWKSDPFDPQERGDDLFARGASDMKGQLVAHLKAVESLARTTGIPVNLKYMVEGEEEIGSPSLEAFIRQNKDRFTCDLCLNGDSGVFAPDIPSLTYALRGLSYFEIRLQGPATDLHSGSFGGVVENPATILCRLIAGMRDAQGRVTLPGFYDKVRPLTKAEREELARLPINDQWWLERTGAPILSGEPDYTPTERAKARPTFDVNGLLSGFTGEGSKTVLPAKAMGKFSMRLVPDQTPEDIRQMVQAYLEQHVPPSIQWELIEHSSCRPAIVERDSAAVKAASRALEAVWGKPPIFERAGGSVPVVGMIQEILGVDSLLLGFGLPDDNLHAPNEKQHLPTFFRGIETSIRFLSDFAAQTAR